MFEKFINKIKCLEKMRNLLKIKNFENIFFLITKNLYIF